MNLTGDQNGEPVHEQGGLGWREFESTSLTEG